ncbi:bifunctional folylpolyglutamate synthase/dihydrofolate synthase [Wolbachia endosymbiont of Dirofilaria (Dirofilaria) immitis]|uniref:bifunctional folylpolyglutamate synthase/dihydrofolate synthase n=1 Tax=Wolbachia endosymbiont of Dirofilaria (Dirofilaria) immitis TaxID=1812115 RepID=UPI00158ACD30|nr:folylpolyglutamate synthase/dihydrofolate synthase family protein [Wolbachia endosymbiont of Dirofilaria (Dirofilaria) immitis]QKX02400.1 bifunctional folylpolyglutamate synthase/dihydrofolate synthase [Wolbachia endosymbiont of Dirofilaria (Dirofilaria) immitis]
MIYMPHWPKPLGSRPKDFSLKRIKSFLNKLGNPERKMPPVIHIAGTNGKGSTLSFIRYMLQAAKYKVHAYTSPHLVNFNERIVVAGSYIDDNELHNLLEECRSVIVDQPITLFEATTVAAFLVFSRYKADVTLIEVGMGGRLDATNTIDNPILTIVTSIALDHAKYLGPTLEIIAGEKAGIMKCDVPCIIAPQKKSIMNTLERCAINNRSPLFRGGFEWDCKKQNSKMTFQSAIQSIKFPLPSLEGNHQIINAGNAIAACSILSGKYGFDIGKEDITLGLQHTYWPGRLELIKKGNLISLLPKNWQLFLDGAHNSDGARVLAEWIKDNFAEGIYIIFGITRNRSVEEFLEYLKPYIKLLCVVCVKSEPESINTRSIRKRANNIGINAIECKSISDAILNHILKASVQNIKTILICGSLFLARDFAMENSYNFI